MTAAPGPALLEEVIARAGRQCECTGECGRRHRSAFASPGRCDRPDAPWSRLHAVPRDPVSPRAAAALPARALHALCDPCHAACASIHARARQGVHGALSTAEPLF
jgi:hypothetical protein